MIASRWIAILLACVVIATAGFGAGMGTVALFSDTETISGSFSVDDGQQATAGSWTTNGSVVENGTNGGTDGENESGTENGTGPGAVNGTDGGNTTNDGNTSNGVNATDGGGAGDGGNASDGENGTDSNATTGSIAVTAVSLEETELLIGETATVHVTVNNGGDSSASFDASLGADGATVTDGSIELGPNESATLSLQHAFDSSGTYTLTAAGAVAGDVTVTEPEPDVSVVDGSLGSGTVEPNETVTTTTTVVNDGSASGTIDVVLTADGVESTSVAVTVPAGATETVTVEESFENEGSYALAVNGVSVGTVDVVESSGNTTE